MAPKQEPRTLAEFSLSKKRAGCKVCALPEPIMAQVRIGRDKGIKRAWIQEWLQTDHSIAISEAEFVTHASGHHE